MCDYSLAAVKSQPAAVDDKLKVHNFGTGTSGFALRGAAEPIAVCLRPGTEVAFEAPVIVRSMFDVRIINYKHYKHRTAIFRQINKDRPMTHHDALEFPDGELVLLSTLEEGQCATVLQLPARPKTAAEIQEQKRAEYAG